MVQTLDAFITKWAASGASERANKDAFLLELCDALDVPRPNPTTGDGDKDTYVFERDAKMRREVGVVSVGKIDLYKSGCFILEAKQGSEAGAKKVGTAKRGTPAWNIAMRDAYGQALGYARSFDKPVPFLIATDLGHCFDLYAAFDGSWDYRPFPNAQASRIYFSDLPKHLATLRGVFLDPFALDPSKLAAKVTREVATYLANLAKQLEADGHPQELVATFLMRCLFTMFAEDVGLLPDGAFTKALREYWVPSPKSFPIGVESLWRTMNEGGDLFTVGRILEFNGGLFREPRALPLSVHALQLLLVAAECNWAEVEPAIFGTLLERALDPKERHRLGAHYTPRAYVERLVRPTIEEPLRADWDIVQAEVRQLVASAEAAKTEKAAKEKIKNAVAAVRAFHQKLCKTRVLDPACGSGNFLYVTLDLFKRLEGEILVLLESLGEKQTLLHMQTIRVTPQQFLGIEVKRWAKEIAELVLWIGYLQWHFRMYGKNLPVPEPVLQDYKNIEWRDAVLAYDSKELVLDERAKPVTRWDGETMKLSPVTGEEVPDETARVPMYRYTNPRKAEWPEADFIVGNPPFVGNKRMQHVLGPGYVEALRNAQSDVPESADLVMYWWNRAACLLRSTGLRRFGFITTNSITQAFNRRVLDGHLGFHKRPIRLIFAIPDHPWVESGTGAAVRIAATVAEHGEGAGVLTTVTLEQANEEAQFDVQLGTRKGIIHSDLTVGPDVTALIQLRANQDLAFMGVTPVGEGFRLTVEDLGALAIPPDALPDVVRPYVNGRELSQRREGRFIIDFFGHSEAQARLEHPALFQRVLNTVRPERQANANKNRDSAQYAKDWWLFAKTRPQFRRAVTGLSRYVATCRTARHRVFVFLGKEILPDTKVVAVASADALTLALLSTRCHIVFATAVGGWLGAGNDPTYNSGACFGTFPFPACAEAQVRRVRQLGESLDAHRKLRQATHPKLTITGMYNVLEKLRSGEPLTDKDKLIHDQGLVSILKKLHDDLDAAVFDAYGWPHDLTDEQILERLVALNHERAEEERKGIVRWLRPEYQNPAESRPMMQAAIADDEEGDDDSVGKAPVIAATAWPKKLADQIGAVRDLVTKTSDEWSVDQVATAFAGAKKSDVEQLLDGLAALGLLVGYELVEGRRWRASRFVG